LKKEGAWLQSHCVEVNALTQYVTWGGGEGKEGEKRGMAFLWFGLATKEKRGPALENLSTIWMRKKKRRKIKRSAGDK